MLHTGTPPTLKLSGGGGGIVLPGLRLSHRLSVEQQEEGGRECQDGKKERRQLCRRGGSPQGVVDHFMCAPPLPSLCGWKLYPSSIQVSGLSTQLNAISH
jgi:hypothetical protein